MKEFAVTAAQSLTLQSSKKTPFAEINVSALTAMGFFMPAELQVAMIMLRVVRHTMKNCVRGAQNP